MVTTNYVDFAAGLNSIPDRTDNTGTAVADLSGREEPLPNRLLDRGGTLTPAGAFVPAKGTGDFDVDIGSGTADQDLYVVESDVVGQAPFIVRLEQTTATVTLDAADADDRWDQIFLVVRDATEDGNADGHTLARLSYRKGDSGTSPVKPGADAEWVHYELIASILVPGGATSITDSDITDERVDSSLLQKLFNDSVRRTAASVFGEVLDSRYLELAGDTATGDVKWTGGWPTVERTDDSGNTWVVRLDMIGSGNGPDSPRVNVRKNGANYASLQWNEANSRWELDNGPLSMSSNKVTNVADPTNAQDAATKGYADATTSNVEVFTADGTFTVPSNVERVLITAVAAGGGGGGATTATSGRWNGGAGGGAGATRVSSVAVSPGDSITVTVGSGGAGGSGSNGGSAGGDSDTSVTSPASGGGAGGGTSDSAVGEGGAGGTPGTWAGSDGSPGALADTAVPSGSGGGSWAGGGGRGRVDGVLNGGNGRTGGGGGGGTTNSTTSDASGGSGGDGRVIIEW